MTATHSTGPTAAHQPRWELVLRMAAARAFLTALASLLLWAVAPVALGWQPQLILTGSMMPRIAPGDVIVIKEVEPTSLKPGQVVTVDDPDHHGRTRTHRITRIDDQGRLILRGDANRADDSSPVELDAVHGAGALRVPYVGRPLLWLGQGAYLPLGIFLVLLTWSTVTVMRGTPGSRSDEDDDGDDRGTVIPMQGRPHSSSVPVTGPHRRRVGLGIAGMVVAAVAVGAGPAEAAFGGVTSNPSSSFGATTSFGVYRSAVRADSPFLYWRLEETGGTTVVDSSGNGRNAATHGTPTFGVTGALASAPSDTAFTLGGQRFTQSTGQAAPGVFSIEAWIRTTTTTGGRIVGYGNGSGTSNSSTIDRNLYVGTDGKVYFGVGTTTKVVVASPAAVNDGAWHHVVATYSGSGANGMKLYVDGALVGQGTGAVVSFTGRWRVGGDVMSGWTANPTTNWYHGSVDEVATYTTALSATRVTEHYNRAF